MKEQSTKKENCVKLCPPINCAGNSILEKLKWPSRLFIVYSTRNEYLQLFQIYFRNKKIDVLQWIELHDLDPCQDSSGVRRLNTRDRIGVVESANSNQFTWLSIFLGSLCHSRLDGLRPCLFAPISFKFFKIFCDIESSGNMYETLNINKKIINYIIYL